MAQNTNMLITAALAIVIVIAIGAYAYTNLFNPDQTPVDENNDMTPDKSGDQNIDNTDEINLTIEFLDTNYTFSISDLEKMKIDFWVGRDDDKAGLKNYKVTGREWLTVEKRLLTR